MIQDLFDTNHRRSECLVQYKSYYRFSSIQILHVLYDTSPDTWLLTDQSPWVGTAPVAPLCPGTGHEPPPAGTWRIYFPVAPESSSV